MNRGEYDVVAYHDINKGVMYTIETIKKGERMVAGWRGVPRSWRRAATAIQWAEGQHDHQKGDRGIDKTEWYVGRVVHGPEYLLFDKAVPARSI